MNNAEPRLQARLTTIRKRMDDAYTDKLDGKIPEDFWERKMSDWRMEEQQVRMALEGLKRRRNERPGSGRAKDFRTRE